MPRHRRKVELPSDRLPAWVKVERNECLVSVAEEAYTALHLAVTQYDADRYPSCGELLASGAKSLAALNNSRASVRKRCAQGERAARKFWEAKACARRLASRSAA